MPGFKGVAVPPCTSQAGDCTAVTTLPIGGFAVAGTEAGTAALAAATAGLVGADGTVAAPAYALRKQATAAASTKLGFFHMAGSLGKGL